MIYAASENAILHKHAGCISIPPAVVDEWKLSHVYVAVATGSEPHLACMPSLPDPFLLVAYYACRQLPNPYTPLQQRKLSIIPETGAGVLSLNNIRGWKQLPSELECIVLNKTHQWPGVPFVLECLPAGTRDRINADGPGETPVPRERMLWAKRQ